jgi:hypothetical protein
VIAGAALCPHPPMLVLPLASGAGPDLDGLRAAVGYLVATWTARG